jgi:hypothetical protein
LLAGEAIKFDVVGIQFRPEDGTAVLIPFKRWKGNTIFSDFSPFRRIPFMSACGSPVFFPLFADNCSKFFIRIPPYIIKRL